VIASSSAFATSSSIEFRPTLQAQRDHAANYGQQPRADLFAQLLNSLNGSQAS